MRYFMRHLCHFLLALFFLLIFFKPACSAQDFVRLGKVGEWNNNYGDFKAVDVKEINGNTYAFCATSRGMVVFSIHYENVGQNRTKAEVTFISLVSLGGCTDIVIEESGGFEKNFYAYITTGDKGLYIRNVTDPKFSYHIVSCDTPGIAEGVAVSGEYAFVAYSSWQNQNYESGIQIIDISDKENPVIVGSCDTPGIAEGVAVSGEYAFLAGGENGLYIINITDKKCPVKVETCDTPGYARRVAISKSGNYAFVADDGSGLQIIDISIKEEPNIIGSCDTPGYARGVAISKSEDYAFVADGGSGLQIIDISIKEEPNIVGSCYTLGIETGVVISESEDYAFVAYSSELSIYDSSLQVIDISNKKGPVKIGSCDTLSGATGVAVSKSEDYAFVADGIGLHIIDISIKGGPRIVSTCVIPAPGYARGVAISESEDYAFVTDGIGLHIIDISNKQDPNIIGFCVTPGNSEGVALSGEYAFIADGESGLQVIDITDKNNPMIAGSCNTPGYARGVAISESEDYAFVADGESGLQIIDISKKEKPNIIGSHHTLDNATGVAITESGNYAFVTCSSGFEGRLLVIDINKKKDPMIIGSCDTPYDARGVAISKSEDYAFVAYSSDWSIYDSGLQVINISKKERPLKVGSCNTLSGARGVAISESGDYAFVADGVGLQVINLSIKGEPNTIGSCYTIGNERGVAISESGNYAFAANGVGLQVIDLSNKKYPVRVGSCATPGFATGVAISKSGDYAFVADGIGLQVINIINKEKPRIVGTCVTPDLGYATGVAISESADYAFLAYSSGLEGGLLIMDISNKENPVRIASCVTPGYATEVAISESGNYAFVAYSSGLEGGLLVIDTRKKEEPMIIGSCATPGSTTEVAISESGDYAFVAYSYGLEGGLLIMDISNKEDPVRIASCTTPGSATGIAISESDDYAFVADWDNGLQVIDISNKEDPKIVGSCYALVNVLKVAISGNYAFLTYSSGWPYESGLQVIDISNEEGPIRVGSCDAHGLAYRVALSGDYVFVANGRSGLHIIDISNEEGPVRVGSCDTPGSAEGVALSESEKYAFVADGVSGLHVIDINIKEKPVIIGTKDTPGFSRSVAISETENYAFVADGESGLQVIDISIKEKPNIVGTCDTPGNAEGVALSKSGNYAFVADGESGLHVIDISIKERPVIIDSCDTPGYAKGVAISKSGNYAFVADGIGLQIIDIGNEGGPVIIGSCVTPGNAEGIALSETENYAFVADGEYGLQVIDISSKGHPVIISSCDTPDYTMDVNLSESGEYAFVADRETGLLKFKINIGPSPPGKGNLILVAGGNINYKSLNYSSPGQQPTNILMRKRETTLDFPDNKASYWQITQALANHVFNTFQNSGYEVYDIYYFNPDPLQDTDNDGYPNQLVVDDPHPTRERLMKIIRQFPEDHLANDGPLYIYLLGHASQDSFLITSNSVITAQDLRDAIDKFQNGYTDSEGTYHPGTNRQVVLIIESSASGTFINDLAGPGITVITSTDEGASYIEPDFSDTESIPYNSFTKALIDSLAPHLDPNNIPEGPPEILNARINNLLKEAFIAARNQIRQWAVDGGQPFTDQVPQMALPETELISLRFSENKINPLSYLSISTFQDIPYDLTIIGYDLNNTPIPISEDMTFFSSDTTILDPGNMDDIQMILDPNHIPWYSIFPKENGRITLIAYPAEETDPHHLLSAKINIDVSIDDPVYFKDTGRMAIIVAGYQGIEDYLWESTNRIANYAYKTLRNMGYTKQEIYYYNPYLMQDPVENSACHDKESCNDIDGYPMLDIFEPDTDLNSPYCAFSKISDPNIKTKELFLYLVGHGTQGAFCLNPTTLLQADYLIDRIEAIAEKVSDKIVFVYDASYSGSFLSEIEKRSVMDGNLSQKLITITSTDPNQKAYFLNQGLTSFSYPFFSKWFTTSSLMTAYDHARGSLSVEEQTPCISDPALVHLWDQERIYYIDEGIPVIETEEKAMALIISSDPDIFPEEDTREKLTAQLNQSHAILLNRGFSEAQIKYITTLNDLDNVSFLTEADTLFIYIIGKTQMQENGAPYFVLNTYEALTPERFSNITWNTGQRLLILMDTPYACQFLSAIDPNHLPENWAGIASTDQGDLFFHIYEDPNKKSFPSFSGFFFSMIHSGATVAQAYRTAKNMVSITQQNPALFLKTGVETEYDINRYLNYYIGTSAIYEKGDALFTECSAKVENNNLRLSLTANPGIDENNFNTWVVLKPSPSSMTQNIMIVDLYRATDITNTVVFPDGQENPSGPLYIQEMLYNPQYLSALFIAEGRKQSDETILTEWQEIPILQSTIDIGVDTYEPDDDPNIILFDKRHEIIINAPPKRHTFYNEYTDWSYFYATEGCIYEVYAQDLSEYGYFIQLALYDPNIRPIQSDGHYLVSHNYLAFPCDRSGYYLLKVTPASGYPPEGVEYILNVLNPSCCHEVPFEMNLPAGWAMISLPVIPNSLVLSALFPEAVVVYGYKKESGYVRIKRGEELEPGKGYWILFNNAQNFVFTGQQIYEYPFSFSQDGWDMIGGCTYPAKVSSDSCAIDVIYEYVPELGYQRLLETDHIEPGKGYWILCNDISDHCQIRIKTEDP